MDNKAQFNSIYAIKEQIGQGTFGAVFKCINKITNANGALKKMEMPKDLTGLKRLLREVLLLKYLHHEHLIELRDIFIFYDNKTYIYFITDLMHMNLRDLITSYNAQLPRQNVKFYLYQMFEALNYLHLNNIVHRDIKPDNILVNSDNVVKVTDFGWARHIDTDNLLTKVIANIHYRAPEICLRNEVHNSKVDIWALGCIFYEMLYGKILFPAQKDLVILESIFVKFGTLTPNEINFIERKDARKWVSEYAYIPKVRPSQCLIDFDDLNGRDLFDKCMTIDPTQRISAVEAINHPYFADIHDWAVVQEGMIQHSSGIDFSFEMDRMLQKMDLFKRIVKEVNTFKSNQGNGLF